MARTITSEEDLIQRYLAPLAASAPGAFGLKDDCAAMQPANGHDLILTTDALTSGLHFFSDELPETIAWRALSVNVSDLAGKGATPLYYLMALSFPEVPTDEWMMRFAGGLTEMQERYGIVLVGGDTDHRPGVPLSINITAIGQVKHAAMMRRSTAHVGDRIFVSGTLGDAALGLILRRNPDTKRFPELDKEQRQFLLERYLRPAARIELSELLLKRATASMDISDGLAKDLGRLCKASGVGARISVPAVPLSGAASRVLAAHAELSEAPLAGGDDYEILATVSPKQAEAFEEAALEAGVAATDIGEITKGSGVEILDAAGKPVVLSKAGYDHF